MRRADQPEYSHLELSEHLGIQLLNEKLDDSALQDSLEFIFPKHDLNNIWFSIDIFTSIGLGRITEGLYV